MRILTKFIIGAAVLASTTGCTTSRFTPAPSIAPRATLMNSNVDPRPILNLLLHVGSAMLPYPTQLNRGPLIVIQ